MSKIGLIFLFILMAGPGYGQEDHFVLIRSDNGQPFYIRIGEQVESSSVQGHLILAQLKDSVYPVTVGFPRQSFPEQDFSLAIDNKDMEFRLQYLDGRGWALYNMATLELQMPVKKDTAIAKTRLEGVKKDDAFSRLMAGLVSDTAVMYNTYTMEALRDSIAALARDSAARDSARKTKVSGTKGDSLARNAARPDSVNPTAPGASVPKPEFFSGRPDSVRAMTPAAVKPDSSARKMDTFSFARTPSLQKTDSLAAKTGPSARKTDSSMRKANPSPRADSSGIVSVPPHPGKPARIQKIGEKRTASSLNLSYTDRVKGKAHRTDTIDIQIPLDTLPPLRPVPAGSSPPKKDSTNGGPSAPSSSAQAAKTARMVKDKPVVANSDCRSYASDEDVDKLKVKLKAILADEAKIVAAKKFFKLKCFSTNQLKDVSELFPDQSGKYRFLEMAYPFVWDDRFRELAALFTDPVYAGKFKTLVGAGGQ